MISYQSLLFIATAMNDATAMNERVGKGVELGDVEIMHCDYCIKRHCGYCYIALNILL